MAEAQAQSGGGWSAPAVLDADAGNSQGITLVSDPFGAAHIVWEQSDGAALNYSRWDGNGWTQPIDILAATGTMELGLPELVASADGRLHLFWAQDRVMHSWAWADKANSALAWSVPEAIVVMDGFASGPVGAKEDSSGALHLVFALGQGDVFYVRSDDGGLNWTIPVPVSRVTPNTTTAGPRLDIGPDGRLHAIWVERSLAEDVWNGVFYAYSTDSGQSWSVPRQFAGLANTGGNLLAADDGTVYAAWQAGIASESEGRYLQRSTDGGLTWETPHQFSDLRGLSGYPSMALDSAGTLHVVTGDGEYVFWDNRSISSPVDLRPLPDQTENSRLVVVNGNQLLVSIMPFLSTDLYYTIKQLPLPPLPAVLQPVRETETAIPAASEGALIPSTAAASAMPTINPLPPSTSGTVAVSALIMSVGALVAFLVTIITIHMGRRRR